MIERAGKQSANRALAFVDPRRDLITRQFIGETQAQDFLLKFGKGCKRLVQLRQFLLTESHRFWRTGGILDQILRMSLQ